MMQKISDVISEYSMLESGERVLVGLSGGADSVSLALCLSELGYSVCCVHINHSLRGEESDRDEAFCVAFCEKHGFELKCYKVDVKSYCIENKLSTELGARQLRYECFGKAAHELCCDKIATAHTLSDCLETTLINLVRGCGIKGICGIPPVRERYIRPLINCTREEIEQYLSDAGESYVTDSTNSELDCTRNIIRHSVVPQLKGINEGLMRSYLSTVRNLRQADGFFENLCQQSINNAKISDNSFDVASLSEHGSPVTEMALSSIMKQQCGESSAERISDCLHIMECGCKVTLRGEIYAQVKGGVLTFMHKTDEIGEFCQSVSTNDPFEAFGKQMRFEHINKDGNDEIFNKKFTNHELDYDKIKGNVFVRNRRPGDKVKLAGRNITSSVKTLFNADVVREDRAKIFFLCDEQGIVFIEGYGCADRVKCDKNTVNILKITVEAVT